MYMYIDVLYTLRVILAHETGLSRVPSTVALGGPMPPPWRRCYDAMLHVRVYTGKKRGSAHKSTSRGCMRANGGGFNSARDRYRTERDRTLERDVGTLQNGYFSRLCLPGFDFGSTLIHRG